MLAFEPIAGDPEDIPAAFVICTDQDALILGGTRAVKNRGLEDEAGGLRR